jgi:hypothetical protein
MISVAHVCSEWIFLAIRVVLIEQSWGSWQMAPLTSPESVAESKPEYTGPWAPKPLFLLYVDVLPTPYRLIEILLGSVLPLALPALSFL